MTGSTSFSSTPPAVGITIESQTPTPADGAGGSTSFNLAQPANADGRVGSQANSTNVNLRAASPPKTNNTSNNNDQDKQSSWLARQFERLDWQATGTLGGAAFFGGALAGGFIGSILGGGIFSVPGMFIGMAVGVGIAFVLSLLLYRHPDPNEMTKFQGSNGGGNMMRLMGSSV